MLTINNQKISKTSSSFYVISNFKYIFINVKLPLINLINLIQELN